MECLYNNGVFADHFNIDRTPLEACIARYEKNVDQLAKITNEHFTDAKSSKRAQQKKEALNFLERERQKLITMGQVYDRLEEYRNQGMQAVNGTGKERAAALLILQQEEHHPTSELENNMRAEGIPKPSCQHTSHHICPGKGRFEKKAIRDARLHMHKQGIRINDPANGVYLLTKDDYTPHYTMPNSRGHLKYHTREYEMLVSQRVMKLPIGDMIKTNLQVIGRILQQNEPKSAFSKIKVL